MTIRHRELATGRWFRLGFLDQMANIGSEVERALLWNDRGDPSYSMKAVERALELIGFTVADPRNRARLRELTRLREALVDYFCSDNRYGSSDESWRGYFRAFAWAVRRDR